MLVRSSTTEPHPKPPMPIFYNCFEHDSYCCIWRCRAADHPTRMKSFPLASTTKDMVLGILHTIFNLNAIFKGRHWKVLSTTAIQCNGFPKEVLPFLQAKSLFAPVLCLPWCSPQLPLCLMQIISLLLVRFFARLFVRCFPVSPIGLFVTKQALMEYL